MSKVIAELTKRNLDARYKKTLEEREKTEKAAKAAGIKPLVPKLKFNGKPVVNATEPFTFHVYPRDSRNGKQKDPMTCAIANSLLRKQGVRSVRIGLRVAQVEKSRVVYRYAIHPEDTKKIEAFDKSHYFAPGDYTLLPPVTYKATDKRAGKKHGEGGAQRSSISARSPICSTGRHMRRRCDD